MSNLDDDLSARLRKSLDRGAAPDLNSEVVSGAAAHPAPRLSNPSRTLRVAGGAGLAVAVITVGALALGPALRPAPLFTAASGESTAAGARTVETSDMKIGMWVDYNYSAGDGLSTATGNGNAYQLVLKGDPETRAAQIAEVFGVDGDAAEASYSDASYPAWVVGPEDGTAPAVNLTWSGTGDWWYSDPTASSFWICDPSVTADQVAEFGCVLPENAPANEAPDEADARTQAQQLLAETGFTVDASDITVTAYDGGTTAIANLTVGGVKTALDWTINWSNTGDISYAYGHSVAAESRGSFGTISARDAVARLDDGRWWGQAGPDYQGGVMTYAANDLARTTETDPDAADPEALEGPTAPSEAPTAEPAPSEEPIQVDPIPAEPLPTDQVPTDLPTPEVVNVTVDTAEATLLLMWDADGNAWLVPGYAMQVSEGGWNTVVSLHDGVIVLPEH